MSRVYIITPAPNPLEQHWPAWGSALIATEESGLRAVLPALQHVWNLELKFHTCWASHLHDDADRKLRKGAHQALHTASASEGLPAARSSCCRAGRGTSAAPLPPSRTAISEQPRGRSPVRTQPRQLMSASDGGATPHLQRLRCSTCNFHHCPRTGLTRRGAQCGGRARRIPGRPSM